MTQTQMNQGSAPILPLLMGCTKPQPIETLEHEEHIIYDPVMQITQIDMRTVGTYSLKVAGTRYKNTAGGYSSKTDKKNEIDDSKSVK